MAIQSGEVTFTTQQLFDALNSIEGTYTLPEDVQELLEYITLEMFAKRID